MKLPHYVEIETKCKRFGILPCKRTRGFLFDMYAWYLLWQSHGWDFEAIRKTSMDDLSVEMLYFGAVAHCKEIGKRIDFTRDDVMEWEDKLTKSKRKELAEVLQNSIPNFEKDGGGDSKKKR
jgi:hypothetical protein